MDMLLQKDQFQLHNFFPHSITLLRLDIHIAYLVSVTLNFKVYPLQSMAVDSINCKFRFTDKKLYWDGTIDDLKQFVAEKLKLSGKWSLPGVEVKLFTLDSLSLKWQGKTKKLITVTGKSIETNNLIDLLNSFCNDGVSVQSAMIQSNGSCRKETTYNMADPTLVEEIHKSNTFITNGDANDRNSVKTDSFILSNLMI